MGKENPKLPETIASEIETIKINNLDLYFFSGPFEIGHQIQENMRRIKALEIENKKKLE